MLRSIWPDMRVWVTRSQPGADRQGKVLGESGYSVLIQPVLEIAPIAIEAPVGGFDLVIFLSEHAVRWGLPYVDLGEATLLAVGPRTAEVLHAAGLAVRVPHTHSSEGLLRMSELQQIRGARILLVCGAAGRELLAPALVERGASVQRLICYQRVPATRLAVETGTVDAIIAASGDGLKQIARLWFAAGGEPGVALLVPSARVAEMAVELGFVCIHDCGGADTSAVLSTLDGLRATGVR